MGVGILEAGQDQAPLEVDLLGFFVDILRQLILIPYREDLAVRVYGQRAGPGLFGIDGVDMAVVQQLGGRFCSPQAGTGEHQQSANRQRNAHENTS